MSFFYTEHDEELLNAIKMMEEVEKVKKVEKQLSIERRKKNEELMVAYEGVRLANMDYARASYNSGSNMKNKIFHIFLKNWMKHERLRNDYKKIKKKHLEALEKKKFMEKIEKISTTLIKERKLEGRYYYYRCPECGGMKKCNLDFLMAPRFCKSCKEKKEKELMEMAGVPIKYLKNYKIKEDGEAFHFYFGGKLKPDGEGHGHYVFGKNGVLTYARDSEN